MRVVLVTVALLVAVVPAVGSPAGPVGHARLTISVWPEGRGAAKPMWSRTLRCGPPGGSHAAPARACRRLFANLGALRPVPAGRVCTSRHGGQQQAVVSGTVNGRRIRAALNRRNGCEIKRWDRLAPLLRKQALPTSLRITVWPRGRTGNSFQTTLTCEPAGGTHPSPERACARLSAVEDPFGQLPFEMPCALVSSGPQVAVVEGSYRGKAIDARFDRSDSCETRRWDRIAILFASP